MRYVDDLLLFADQKSSLWEWKQELTLRLISLRLTFHPGAHPRPVTEGIPFLGFIVFPQKRRLKRRKGVQFQRKLSVMLKAREAGVITDDTLAASIQGWLNHVRHGNTTGLRRSLLREVPEEVLELVHVPIAT